MLFVEKAPPIQCLQRSDASRAIDGNVDGNFANQSVTHTQEGYQSWWEINLGNAYTIDHINISPRTDCCEWRLSELLHPGIKHTVRIH